MRVRLPNKDVAVILTCLLALSAPAAAATYHWQGAGTGDNTATDPADPAAFCFDDTASGTVVRSPLP